MRPAIVRGGVLTLLIALTPIAPAWGAMPDELRAMGVSQMIWDSVERLVRAESARTAVPEKVLQAVAEKIGVASTRNGYFNFLATAWGVVRSSSQIRKLQAQLEEAARSSDASDITHELELALAALQSGDIDAAADALGRVLYAREKLARGGRPNRAALLAKADAIAAVAAVEMLRGEYRKASSLFTNAAAATPVDAVEPRWNYYLEAGGALDAYGADYRDGERLAQAQKLLEQNAQSLAPRSRRPENWARTKIAVGSVHEHQGALGDVSALEAAVVVYRDALAVLSPSKGAPWLEAQEGLARSLQSLVNRAPSEQLLTQALHAHEVIIASGAYDADSDIWAGCNSTMGEFLVSLGDLAGEKAFIRMRLGESCSDLCDRARDFYNQAIARYQASRERVPALEKAWSVRIAVATKKRDALGAEERLRRETK